MFRITFIPVFFLLTLQVIVAPEILLEQFEMCDPNYDYDISLQATIKTVDSEQIFNFSTLAKSPMGHNQELVFEIQYSEDRQHFADLFTIRRDDACDFFNKDLGPFWFETQRQLNVPVGSCPALRKGRYNLRNSKLPMGKLPFRFPKGYLRTFMYIFDKETGMNMSCLCVIARML